MYFFVVALKETVSHLGSQEVSINVLGLDSRSDRECIGLRDDKMLAA